MKEITSLGSLGRLIALTIVVGVLAGVSSGFLLRLFLGTEDRALLAALTAAITASVTTAVVMSRFRDESKPEAG